MNPAETRLLQVLGNLDEEGLVALANPGLLRRARKDLQQGLTLQALPSRPDAMVLQVGEARVTVPFEQPTQPSCTCPAARMCQHRVAALLHLQSLAIPGTPEAPLADPAEALWRFTPSTLKTWAGAAAYWEGLDLAHRQVSEVQRTPRLVIRFPQVNASVQVLPGTGPESWITRGAASLAPAALVTAAVVAFHRASSRPWPEAPRTVSASDAETPRSRAELLTACRELLLESVRLGLAQIPVSHPPRWTTLSVSALGMNLPRLALLLRSLADDAASALARQARHDPVQFLQRLSGAFALVSALAQAGDLASPELVGSHRTRYDDVGTLNLVGIAAWPWQTASGHLGLTLLFWDVQARQWTTWTEARQVLRAAGFIPRRRYLEQGPWSGAPSPEILVRRRFKLLRARRNAAFRLSSTAQSQVLITGPSLPWPEEVPVVRHWGTLQASQAPVVAMGLTEADPLASLVVMEPAAWIVAPFDPVRQVLEWTLLDEEGASVTLRVPFDSVHEPVLRQLEFHSSRLGLGIRARMVGRWFRGAGGIIFEPYAMVLPDQGLRCLALEEPTGVDSSAVAGAPEEAVAAGEAKGGWEVGEPGAGWDMDTDMDMDLDMAAETESPGAVAALGTTHPWVGLLEDVEDLCLAMAESGMGGTLRPSLGQRLKEAMARSRRLSLPLMATALGVVETDASDAANLLRLVDLMVRHRQALHRFT